VRLTPPVRAVFGLEIRSLLRDVRTLLISVVLPVVLIPALLLASAMVEDRRMEREESRSYRFAITGTDAQFAAALTAGITSAGPDAREAGAEPEEEGERRFRQVRTSDPRAALESEALDVWVEAFTAEEWRARAEGDTAAVPNGVPPEFEGVRVLRIRFHSSRTASREGAEALRTHLLETREFRRDSMLVAAGFPVSPSQVAPMEAVNVASEEEVQGARLGRFLTLILLGLMLLGGSAVATDTLAGEKERGTLTTLLTSAASRTEIVTGKLLAIMAVALVIALVQILNLWIYLGLGVIDASRGFAAAVSPGMAVGLMVLYLPVVALTAGVLLLTSAHARTYKEAQLYLTPVLLGMTIPALAPFLPDLSLRSAIVVVPIANLAIAARDLLVGQVDPLWVTGAWLITAGAAAWVAARSVRALHDEALLTGDTSREEFLGGPDLFRKRVLRWFAVFWAVKVLLDFNLTFDDLRVTALVSVGLVFLVFPLLVIRRFRLDPVEALALRWPRPGVWVGVALGAPAALVAANAFFRLMDYILPVPTELLENFGQSLMPEGIPAWHIIVLLSVLPGITEELTFRGVLLHGLRRRFGPVGIALVVGLIFGFFHFQIFRIPATALLGVILTAVTLLTGSIFPAIVWHTLNNALALYLGFLGVDAFGESWWWALGSVVALALAFRIIWIHRTPYPDVGPPGRRRGDGRGRWTEREPERAARSVG
jgi:sodium transport system permease protein